MPTEEAEKPTFISFINWGFQALLVALLAWGVTELSGVNKSVQELNIKMGSVLETVKDHEQRLRVVEVKKN